MGGNPGAEAGGRPLRVSEKPLRGCTPVAGSCLLPSLSTLPVVEELARLATGDHPLTWGRAPVDVHALLSGETMPDVPPLSVRVTAETLAELDRLAALMADTPEAIATGQRWGRSAVLRLAVARGLAALRSELPKGER